MSINWAQEAKVGQKFSLHVKKQKTATKSEVRFREPLKVETGSSLWQGLKPVFKTCEFELA